VLYLIRHAQSEANQNRIMASGMPYPLTPAGHADARRIASEFAQNHKIELLISSPLVRAIQTAEPFGEFFGLPIRTDERLKEQDQGVFSGRGYDEIKTLSGYEHRPLARWDWLPEGGESYKMVATRVMSFFQEYSEIFKTKNVLLVTHAVTFRLIRGLLENTLPTYPEGFPNNGEIWVVNFQGLGWVHPITSLFYGDSRNFIHNP